MIRIAAAPNNSWHLAASEILSLSSRLNMPEQFYPPPRPLVSRRGDGSTAQRRDGSLAIPRPKLQLPPRRSLHRGIYNE
jgi:hypothetical protein